MSLTQRIKLAQELHDGIAQDLVGLGYAIDSLIAIEVQEPKRASLRALRFDVSALISKIRSEILELRESTVQDLPINSQVDMRLNLNRIFNEVITNAITHSNGSCIEIAISDDGGGGAYEKKNHHGMPGLVERVNAIGGQLNIDSDGQGTRITISLPMAKQ